MPIDWIGAPERLRLVVFLLGQRVIFKRRSFRCVDQRLAAAASVARNIAELSPSARWKSELIWFRSPQISRVTAQRPQSITPTIVHCRGQNE